MTAPLATQPPDLVGFEMLRHLGGGGFADVYLYQQRRPNRQVAIKVLKADSLTDVDRAAFDGEADLMATVSAHPYIVTIFDAGISGDGRPYLVMEYYRNEHVGVRAQLGMSVAEVLRTGVQVASAVAMLHHNGIVHRDIKPANILISELRKPGLTDFGIAGIQGDDPDEESRGASIPYAPPEVVSGRSVGDRRADVYALAATLYALLARRTPFEADNPTRAVLIQRILTAAPPPLDRPDVPKALELLLQQALAKDPNQRPQSAAAFALSLQGIERTLGYDPTPLEVPDADEPVGASPSKAGANDLGRTEARPSGTPADVVPPSLASAAGQPPEGATVARPAVVSGLPKSTAARAPAPAPAPEGATVARPAIVGGPPKATAGPAAVRTPESATVARPSTVRPVVDPPTLARPRSAAAAAEKPSAAADETRPPRKGLLLVAAAAVVAVVGAGLVVLSSSSRAARTTPQTEPTLSSSDFDAATPPDKPTAVKVFRHGAQVLVSWTQTGDVKPDKWLIKREDYAGAAQVAHSSPYVLRGGSTGRSVCVLVSAVRAAGGVVTADVACLS